jgi:hypothetical protein
VSDGGSFEEYEHLVREFDGLGKYSKRAPRGYSKLFRLGLVAIDGTLGTGTSRSPVLVWLVWTRFGGDQGEGLLRGRRLT